MINYYAPNNPLNPVTVAYAELRRAEFRFWMDNLPHPEDDFDVCCTTLAVATGHSPRKVSAIIMALFRLRQLPQLAEFQDFLLLDLDRLITIDQTLAKLGTPNKELLDQLDEQLVSFLTPTKPNQVLPSRAMIRNKLKELLRDQIEPEEAPKPRYFCDVWGNSATLSLEVDVATAALVDKHIEDTANANKLSRAEAMIQLLTGNVKPPARVVLHTFKAVDVEGAPTVIPGFGVADEMAFTHTRKLDAFPVARGYRTPPVMEAFIEGRDGTCRWPGCEHPAHLCQKDHRINYADGGPTHPDNLYSLCQHHHNIKTDGRAHYLADPVTGDVVWLFEDGTWAATEPTGPMAPKNKRWVQTVAAKINQRNEVAKKEPAPKAELQDIPF